MYSAATSKVLPWSVSAFGDPRLSLLAANRGLSQPCHALHRLSTPEHPLCTLLSLTTLFCTCSDARVLSFTHAKEILVHTCATHGLSKNDLILDTWWRRQDSNPRPSACKAGALPTELRPQQFVMNAERCGSNRAKTLSRWCTRVDSNHSPRAYQARALTN
jgi:hypothetical protein